VLIFWRLLRAERCDTMGATKNSERFSWLT
jgi:hypothetical protein